MPPKHRHQTSEQESGSVGPLLLPDEYCIVEGRMDFEIHCDRIDAQRGSCENIFARLIADICLQMTVYYPSALYFR